VDLFFLSRTASTRGRGRTGECYTQRKKLSGHLDYLPSLRELKQGVFLASYLLHITMPRWTKQEYDAFIARRQASGAKPEQVVRDEPAAAPARETRHPSRIHVHVVSFRTRLCDPDNLCPKYFVDCLRYAGIIPNDREEDISLEVRQVKVSSKTEERTEIEIR